MLGKTRGFEKAIYFTKWSVYLALGWPPSRLATKWQILKHDIALVISIISTLCTLVPLVCSIYVHRHDSAMVAHSVAVTSALCSLIVKMVIVRVHRNQMQILIEGMENFLKIMRPCEEVVLQRYVGRFLLSHTFTFVMTYVGVCLLIVEPVVLSDQPLPMNAVYPFKIDTGILMYLIYIQQSLAVLQAAAGLCIDGQAALIMWCAGARLEILAEELADVVDGNELQCFIRKHKRLISYARKASSIMCYTVFVSATTLALSAVMSGIQLISNQPFAEKVPFGLAAISSSLILYISASPADNLIDVSNLLANAVYNIPWIDMSVEMKRNLLIILRRCQLPITVSIAGVIPTLSLKFYSSFLSSLISYFTTLRAAMSET